MFFLYEGFAHYTFACCSTTRTMGSGVKDDVYDFLFKGLNFSYIVS